MTGVVRSDRRRPLLCVAVLALAAALLTSCSGLQFAQDASVKIVDPPSLATVATPVALRWTGRAPSGSSYAVFVDSLPVHPGQNLRSLAGKTCANAPGCADRAYLERHFVFLTEQDHVELDALPILGTPKSDPDMHTVTIVLVDSSWRRVGESAWSVTFALGRA